MLFGLPALQPAACTGPSSQYLAIHARKELPSKPRGAPHATLTLHTHLRGFARATPTAFGLC